MRRFFTAILAILAIAAPASIEAQTEISARGATLRIGGRLQTQYVSSFVDNTESDFFVRRARILIDADFTDFVSARVQTDFAFGRASLLNAYLRLNFSDRFRVSVGQLKRAFDLFDLVSTNDLSVIERTGEVPGYDECAGVGRLCSYSRLSEGLLLSNRDTGIRFDGSFGRFGYMATITNGTRPTVPDVNDAKSFAGRGTFMVTDDIQLGANVTMKDYLDPDDETAYAFVWGGDVQIGSWRDGFLLQASLLHGENWESLDPVSSPGEYIPGKFLASQVIASYYFPLDSERIVGIEPVGRVSIADPDGSIDDNGGTLVTPGMMFYFLGRNKVGFNYDYYKPALNEGVSSFRFQTYLYF